MQQHAVSCFVFVQSYSSAYYVQTIFRGGNHENFIKVLKRRWKLVDCGYSIVDRNIQIMSKEKRTNLPGN